jgi:hypothetical protein
MHHTIKLRKGRSGWSAWVENPQGGGGNAMTTSKTNKTTALAASLRLVPAGETFVVLSDDERIADGTKSGPCSHNTAPRGCFCCIHDEAAAIIPARRKR